MLKITAKSAEAFNEIEKTLNEFDSNEVFLRYFETAVQSEADAEGITVILKNTKKFKKDLNKKKYIISIPTSLTIDAFEFVKNYFTKGGKRVPFYSVLVKGHLANSEVNIILILTGFNDDAIRILSHDEELAEGDSLDSLSPIGGYNVCCINHHSMPLCGIEPHSSHQHHYHDSLICDEEDFILDTLM